MVSALTSDESIQSILQSALDECVLHRLLLRLGRLLHAVGTRLLAALLRLNQGWRDGESFIKTLNRAERAGTLQGSDRWQFLWERCTQAARESPAQPELTSANLRMLVASVPPLELAHPQLDSVVQTRKALYHHAP